jgi:hypothetical protein
LDAAFEPSDDAAAIDIAARDSKHELNALVRGGVQGESVDRKEAHHRSEAGAFVSIDEWMVPTNEEQVRGRDLFDGCMDWLPAERLAGLRHG